LLPACTLDAFGSFDIAKASRYLLIDNVPYGTAGRALIVPKAHIASYFELPEKLRTACWLMVDRVRRLLEARCAPAGWRIEVVVGGAVAHAHVVLGALGDEA